MRSAAVAVVSLAGALLAGAAPKAAFADEGGASVWLPGQFASFAAVPGDPGFSLETIFYVRKASATAGTQFSRGGGLLLGYDTTEQYLYLTPGYTFADPVLAGLPERFLTLQWHGDTFDMPFSRKMLSSIDLPFLLLPLIAAS